MAVDEAIYREASEPLRRLVWVAIIYTVMAVRIAFAIPYTYTMATTAYSHSTMGRVVALQTLSREARGILTIEYSDDKGTIRQTREGDLSGGRLQVGDTVPVLFNPGDEVARSINSNERGLRVGFIWMSIVLPTLGLIAIGVGLAVRRSRRWLLLHGRVEQGQDPRVTWHTVALLPQLPPTWRLRASWFDPQAACWRNVATAKQGSDGWQPAPDASLMHIYVDPRRPGRAWFPAVHHRARAKKT